MQRRQNYRSARTYGSKRRRYRGRRGTRQARVQRWMSKQLRGPRLSQCARDYLQVQYKPFNPSIKAFPCLPDTKAFPSDKFYLRKRGEFSAATGGNGSVANTQSGDIAYVLFNPWTLSKATDNPCVIYTGPSSTTTASTPVGSSAITATPNSVTGVYEAFWDSPYDSSFGYNNKFRVVAAGIRVNYAGKWDELGGTVCVWKHDTNDRDYFNGTTRNFGELVDFDDAAYGGLSHNKTYECVYHPVDADDFEYGTQGGTVGSKDEDKGFIMAIVIKNPPVNIVTGATPVHTPYSFTYEIIAYYEAIGPDVSGQSPSHSDPIGLGKITSLPQKQSLGASGFSGGILGGMFGNFGKGLAYAFPGS